MDIVTKSVYLVHNGENKDGYRSVDNIVGGDHHIFVDIGRAIHAVHAVPKLAKCEREIFEQKVVEKNAHPVVRIAPVKKQKTLQKSKLRKGLKKFLDMIFWDRKFFEI